MTTFNGQPDPTGQFSPFFAVGVPFYGTAKSVKFIGANNQIAFDDITFGSTNPGIVPTPTAAMGAIALLGVSGVRRRRSTK